MVTHLPTAQEILQHALDWHKHRTQPKPASDALITAFQQVERASKRAQHIAPPFSHLFGTWQLVFTSTSLTTGRWIPLWLPIQITFSPDPLPSDSEQFPTTPTGHDPDLYGSVYNQVQLGALTLTLRGPTFFHPTRSILAFDFTRLTLTLFGKVCYSGSIRGGSSTALRFHEQSLKQQAFFRFFWITPQGIAARGKGGGLALWTKNNAD